MTHPILVAKPDEPLAIINEEGVVVAILKIGMSDSSMKAVAIVDNNPVEPGWTYDGEVFCEPAK